MNLTRRRFSALAAGAVAAQTLLGRWPALADEPKSGDLAALSVAEASAMIHSGKVTPTQLTMACLDRIAVYGPKLDCYITVMREKALAQAAVLDVEQKARSFRGPLHGIPIAVKDNIDTAGTLTSAGSGVFRDRVPTEDAPVITRVTKAGAILLGKANLHEFAMGAGETSYYGPIRNPWDLTRNTAGSSSGSAAAVSADLCIGALGTDTGGSIRGPAAYCGVIGVKATFGLVPIRGIVPRIATRDHCGTLSKRVEDAAMMLNVMAGYDKLDIFSVEHPKEDYVEGMKQPVRGFRLGMPKGALSIPNNNPHGAEVVGIVKTAIDLLGSITAGPAKEVQLPPPGGSSDIETFAYHEEYFKQKAELYQPATRKRLELLALEHESAMDYIRQLQAMELVRRVIDDSFTDFDLVVMPTVKTEPPLLDDLIRRDLMSVEGLLPAATPAAGGGGDSAALSMGAYNAYGIPSLSIPCGFTQDGLPVGLMICGPHFTEAKIFALAAAYEKATQWHLKKPPLTPNMPVPPLITHL